MSTKTTKLRDEIRANLAKDKKSLQAAGRRGRKAFDAEIAKQKKAIEAGLQRQKAWAQGRKKALAAYGKKIRKNLSRKK